MAALTGTIATTAICLKLIESQKLGLTDRVSRYIPSFGVLGKSTITIQHLLNHTAGLAAWHPYFEELLVQQTKMTRALVTSRSAREHIFNSINRSIVKEVGQRRVYSDLGLMLLGHLAETVTGSTLDKLFYKFVSTPLSLGRSSFIDLDLIKRRGLEPVIDQIAPTEECPWRKRILCGEVHDDNAWIMGGVAGHSGLFSTARDIAAFGNELLQAAQGNGRNFSQAIVQYCLPSLALGLDPVQNESNLANIGFSDSAYGLNTFTGCSLWVDVKKELVAVLCSNRIHPSENNKKIIPFRSEFYRTILAQA